MFYGIARWALLLSKVDLFFRKEEEKNPKKHGVGEGGLGQLKFQWSMVTVSGPDKIYLTLSEIWTATSRTWGEHFATVQPSRLYLPNGQVLAFNCPWTSQQSWISYKVSKVTLNSQNN